MNDHSPVEGELSDAQRRAAFLEELRLTPETGGGRIVGRIPKKFMWRAIAVLVTLGLGGQLAEHYFGNLGLATSSPIPTTVFTTPTTPRAATTTTRPSPQSAALSYIGLKYIGSATAPNFRLSDQHGTFVGPRRARGAVTLITFFNKNCNDICPVEGAELRQLLVDLGPRSTDVTVLVVNTDPFSYGVSSQPAALTATGLQGDAQVHFLTGPVGALDAVWKRYGVQVKVGATSNEVAHNAVIYFVNSAMGLVALATPFAHVSHAGRFTLSGADVRRFAQGLTLATISLMP
jgi:cytochrome oxidase Cu insertion factor (SCO1/SenC/PrrC family)